ncbi:hypothetical protein [Streptomyces sp. NBC_01264]|uniref:hypothetical protein n=1 Tax=Streptomyces sp. NBC_01264 TaxID=2903804 RepID=UPI00225BA5F5|nr:hypothetical protein [Streptomyces sp. NBC_01264]MCX4784302.1 hypothetical protein [Streptomyces sp. NBC_01264]
MTIKTTASRVAVLLATAALTSAGAGSAWAATPTATRAAGAHYPNAKTGDYIFFNGTPWTASLGQNEDPLYDPIKIAPGASALVTAAQMATLAPGAGANVVMAVTPSDYANGHDLAIIDPHGNTPGVQTCATGPSGLLSGLGCIAQSPNVVAGETGPTQISIYGKDSTNQTAPLTLDATAPDGDANAMGNFLSGMALLDPNSISFTPDQANPVSWGHGPQVLAGSPAWNCGDGEASEQIGGQVQNSETTNISSTVSVQQQIKLFDTVNTSITASVSVGHAWTTTDITTHTETKNVDPWNVGWINSIPSTQNVTGNVTMTGDAAQPIKFSNVTFSEPGRNASNNPNLNYTYVMHSRKMTQDEIQTMCGGPGPDGNHVVVGGTLPDITAGKTSH